MKKISFSFTFLSAIAGFAIFFGCSLQASAQAFEIPQTPVVSVSGIKAEANTKRLASNDKPGKADYFTWNNGWVADSRSENTYDTQGNILKTVMIDAATGAFMEQWLYVYDAHNTQTERLVQTMVNGQWQTQSGQKHLLTYNANNLITEDLVQEWQNGLWENKARHEYVLNTAGQPTEEKISFWQQGAWAYQVKRTSVYQNNLLSEYLVQNYVNNAWQNFSRFHNYTYDAVTNKTLGYQVQDWVNNAWQDKSRQTFTYDATGGYTNITERNLNGNWENSLKVVSLQDPATNTSGYQVFDWQNNNWVKVSHQEAQRTYDTQNRLTEVIERRWKAATNQLENELKITFYDFQLISGTSKLMPEMQVNVYPNPASDLVTIALNEAAGKEGTISVSDYTGKIRLVQEITRGNSITLKLESWPAGVYFLTLQTEKGTLVKKIVKQ
ncbi:T9SS type A sorting domain-containing protein [Adhaeribacter soli]|uniref:T9SS type A sorting domain-containing protein n=1 Tax=Adhaeribacter soli TaxID=2607655 RepID=A0A5N1J2F1_9BACT|nr:T9SS type A sorting domain-containing protein [Adhaeribacter soli]KAA9340943.1 T9SS type A sorting domain-containing protein [Adhaeribacter soli]